MIMEGMQELSQSKEKLDTEINLIQLIVIIKFSSVSIHMNYESFSWCEQLMDLTF